MKTIITPIITGIVMLFSFSNLRAQTWNTQIVHSGSINGPRSLRIAPDGNPVIFERVDVHNFLIVKWNGNTWQTVYAGSEDWWFGLNTVSGVLVGDTYLVTLGWTDYGSFNILRILLMQINRNGAVTYQERFDGDSPALSVSNNGRVRIAYRYNSALYVKSYNPIDNTSSNLSLVDGSVGENIDVATGTDNRTWISYYDYTSKDLKVAQSDTSGIAGWNIWTVDAQGDVGMYSSIWVDQTNTAHVAYYDATDQKLKYAVFNP